VRGHKTRTRSRTTWELTAVALCPQVRAVGVTSTRSNSMAIAAPIVSNAENVPHRAMITVAAIGATLLQSLDQTIANVALPYMQGRFSASYDEITWVLTSYITAAAIMTAPVGWLAIRFGRKPLYIGCIIGFTITSMLCGAAQSLGQIVTFRLLQGMFSAALVPLRRQPCSTSTRTSGVASPWRSGAWAS
jgi:hypothetical protein